MDKKTKNILSYAFWTLVAGLLIWFCLRAVDWAQFSEALMACRWEYILLSMLLGVAVFYIRGIRWKMLLEPFDPSTSAITTFNAYNICMAVNLVLPRAGEVAKLGYVVRHSAVGEDGRVPERWPSWATWSATRPWERTGNAFSPLTRRWGRS